MFPSLGPGTEGYSEAELSLVEELTEDLSLSDLESERVSPLLSPFGSEAVFPLAPIVAGLGLRESVV